MAHDLHKVRDRKGLEPRREPYWGAPLAADLTLGYRKIGSQGTWIARWRNSQGIPSRRKDKSPPRYKFESFGLATTKNNYEAARQAALKWRESLEAGVPHDDAVTVADACREYVRDRREHKGEYCAHDAEKRFERTVYEKPFGAVLLSRLKTPRIKEWRDGLELSKGSANRTLTALRAALNLAVADRRVHPAAAREWKDVKQFANATQRRTLFLDLRQRRKLLEAAGGEGGLRNLMEAAALTGARAGELTSVTRVQFDPRLKHITFKGKVGARTIPLSPAAMRLFKRLARGRQPVDVLLTRDDGKPWGHSDWDELVREAATKAKLPDGVCLYTLRHSFITQAITDGMTTLDVARLCGTSVGMIEKHYGHLVADAARKRLAAVQMI